MIPYIHSMETKQCINFLIIDNLSLEAITLPCIISVLSSIYNKKVNNWERGNSNMAFKN